MLREQHPSNRSVVFDKTIKASSAMIENVLRLETIKGVYL